MALTICPECAHEISSTAAACPNCGYSFARPTVAPRVIVNELPPERDGFPTWAFIPLGILGVVLLFVFLVWMRNSSDDDQRNINIRVASPPLNSSRETTVRTDSLPNEVVVPSTSQPGQVIVPSAPPTSAPTTVTTVPSTETIVPDRGTVSLEAKVLSKSGNPQPVRAEKFYLLDKDLESILREANIEDEAGQGLVNAFGLSVVYPERYSDFRKKALAAISKHSVYNTLTDSSGKASLKDVKPNSYHLFAITKTGNGFAIWNNSVTIQPGQNSLVLEPISPTEIAQQ